MTGAHSSIVTTTRRMPMDSPSRNSYSLYSSPLFPCAINYVRYFYVYTTSRNDKRIAPRQARQARLKRPWNTSTVTSTTNRQPHLPKLLLQLHNITHSHNHVPHPPLPQTPFPTHKNAWPPREEIPRACWYARYSLVSTVFRGNRLMVYICAAGPMAPFFVAGMSPLLHQAFLFPVTV